jgi:hypothetical protein
VSKDVPVGFKKIRLHFDLDTDASEEQLATLIRLTERYCVVPNVESRSRDQRFAPRYIALKSRYAVIHGHSQSSGEPLRKMSRRLTPDMETQRKYESNTTATGSMRLATSFASHAPNAEAAECVHQAHGMMAEKIIEVQPELAEGFLGGVETNATRAVISRRRSGCAGSAFERSSSPTL